MDQTRDIILNCMNESLVQAVLSGNKCKNTEEKETELCARAEASKVKLRPVKGKDGIVIQAEEFVDVASGTGRKAFHKNMTPKEAASYLVASLLMGFSQCQIQTKTEVVTVLRNKKGELHLTRKKNAAEISNTLSHNKERNYILKEGEAIPFLVDLGVMNEQGMLVKAKYNKFRQLNRFLEFIRDILPELPKNREITILDFGCGKSYLTFAMYYYLVEQQGYDVRIIGLDLKEDVISHCNGLAKKYGYDKMQFLLGDVADYTGVNQVDMVVTLHACDTATDYALAKAIFWGASVILSVPCCQHELNKQMKSEILAPILKYGLLKERMAALLTDGIRANLLEQHDYEVQVMEFIDMEHTPKNILLRAVKKGKRIALKGRNAKEQYEALVEEVNGALTLQRLLEEGRT